MHAVAHSTEPECPSCHAHFRVADRRKRVQCPHCLAVVNLGPAKNTSSGRLVASMMIELEGLKERVESLETRATALMEKIDALQMSPAEGESPEDASDHSALEETAKARPRLWEEPPQRSWTPNVADLGEDRENALIASLAAIENRCIAIQCGGFDTAARALSKRLHEIYRRAGWEVRSVAAASDSVSFQPLALLTSSMQPARQLALHFTALSRAGIHAVSQIDPNSDERDPILVIGSQS